jgi:hypothetical protein
MSTFDKAIASSAAGTTIEAPTRGATTGAPRAARKAELPINTFETGPRMVLDTSIHWTWRNPLNLIPAGLLLLELVSLVGMAIR